MTYWQNISHSINKHILDIFLKYLGMMNLWLLAVFESFFYLTLFVRLLIWPHYIQLEENLLSYKHMNVCEGVCIWNPLHKSPSTLFHIKSFLILIDIQRVVFNVVRGKIDAVVEFVEDVPKQNFTFHHYLLNY